GGSHSVLDDVEATQPRMAGGWREIAGEDLHGRRFTGTIGTKECDDFAALDRERQLIHCSERPVVLAQVDRFDHWLCFGHKIRIRWVTNGNTQRRCGPAPTHCIATEIGAKG